MATAATKSPVTRKYWWGLCSSMVGRLPIMYLQAIGVMQRQCRVSLAISRVVSGSSVLCLLAIAAWSRARTSSACAWAVTAMSLAAIAAGARKYTNISCEKKEPPKTLVQEVASNEPGVRVFVVHSDERLAYERAQRIKSMDRVRAELEALAQRIAKGKLKAPEKIGAAAARILACNHGHRYYGWNYKDRAFSFFEHPVHFMREQAYEGKYIIQTEEPGLSPIEAVQLYKELSEVERAFSNLKDVIDMRPIYHRTRERVEAHIFVAALAFLIHRTIEKKLKNAGLDLSATQALAALKSVRVVDIDLGNGTTKRSVTKGTQRAAAVLRALAITNLDPPTPPKGDQTVV